jgi:hypothetical protein
MFHKEELEEFQEEISYSQRENKSIVIKYFEQQEKMIKEIIRNLNIYKVQIVNNFHKILDVNYEKIEKIIDEKFFCPNLSDFFLLFSNSIFHGIPNNISYFRRIRKWFGRYKSVLKKTTRRLQIMKTTINEHQEGPFIVKLFDGKEGLKNVISEFFIGFMCINKLRKEIPNFSLVLAYIHTSENIDEITDESSLNFNQFPAVVYENVKGISLMDHINKLTVEEFLEITGQIIFAIRTAFVKFKFQHGDFHTANIILKVIERPIFIPYVTEKGITEYFHVKKYIPVIIDYENSVVEIDGIIFYGKMLPSNYLSTSFFPLYGFPIYDIMRLFFNCVKVLNKNSNKPLLDECKKILNKYFVRGEIDKTFIAYPFRKEYRGLKFFDSFIEKFRKDYKLPLLKTEIPIHAVYICKKECEILDELLSEERFQEKNIFYYHDLLMNGIHVSIPDNVFNDAKKSIEKGLEELKNFQIHEESPITTREEYINFMKFYFVVQDIYEIYHVTKSLLKYLKRDHKRNTKGDLKRDFLVDISQPVKKVNKIISLTLFRRRNLITKNNDKTFLDENKLNLPAPLFFFN